jgi:hypothetical protein
VTTIIALVVAAFSAMPFVTNCAPLIPFGDRPSPAANVGINRVYPSGSGQDWFS